MKLNATVRAEIREASDEKLGELGRRADAAHTRASDNGMTQSARNAAEVQDAIAAEMDRRF